MFCHQNSGFVFEWQYFHEFCHQNSDFDFEWQFYHEFCHQNSDFDFEWQYFHEFCHQNSDFIFEWQFYHEFCHQNSDFIFEWQFYHESCHQILDFIFEWQFQDFKKILPTEEILTLFIFMRKPLLLIFATPACAEVAAKVATPACTKSAAKSTEKSAAKSTEKSTAKPTVKSEASSHGKKVTCIGICDIIYIRIYTGGGPMDYHLNSCRNPSRGSDKMKKKIAVFASGWGSEILTDYMRGVMRRLESAKADIYLFVSYATYIDEPEIMQGELNIFNLPDLNDFDAALIFGNSLDFEGVFESLADRCREAGIPLVTTGRKHEYAYYVGSDNYVGAYELSKHVITQHKVKRPFFLAGKNDNPDSATRLKTLRDVLAEEGRELPDSSVFESRWEPAYAFNRIHEMYGNESINSSNMAKAAIEANVGKTKGEGTVRDLTELPDAIICANDSLAMMVVTALSECGVRVPEDVIVTGFDNEYYAKIYSPSIASVNQCFDKMGEEAAGTLLSVFAGGSPVKEVIIPSVFIPSESCGCGLTEEYEEIRRGLGKVRYQDHVGMSLFTREMTNFERCLINGEAYEDIRIGLNNAYKSEHIYLGDSFHVVLDPFYKKSIYHPEKRLLEKGYSPKMDVVFSCNKGEINSYSSFESRRIVPGAIGADDEENRLYIMLSLHEKSHNFGYMVVCDDIEKINDYTKLFAFSQRMSTILSKFRQNLCLGHLNKRLMELTETDGLTNVKNRMAFAEKAKELNTKIRVFPGCDFAIAMFDINDLKKLNDEFGHDSGDDYIVNCCRMICKYFKHSPVFRLGGDEFAAVLTESDYSSCMTLLLEMRETMAELKKQDIPASEKVSMASGVAFFERGRDKSVEDVFKRADEQMYMNKSEMKGSGNVR